MTHVVLDGQEMLCRHCGETLVVIPKGGLSLTAKALKAFELMCEDFKERHAGCREHDRSPSRLAGRSPADWLRGGDTGLSSLTIHSVMTAQPVERPSAPCDPSDFGRCHRLLVLFPAWRARLPEVAKRYPEWSGLVENWAELTALYEEERPTGGAPKLYARMKALLGVPLGIRSSL